MKKVQVTVIRTIPVNGSPFFSVLADGKYKAEFSFEIGRNEDSAYNEERNRLAAMALAAKLENGNEVIEKIIYQTKQ